MSRMVPTTHIPIIPPFSFTSSWIEYDEVTDSIFENGKFLVTFDEYCHANINSHTRKLLIRRVK